MEAISQILEKSMDTNIQMKDDEYLNKSDGLIYCKKCNTPRQFLFDYGDRKSKVKVLCKCQGEEYDHKQELERKKKRMEKVNQLKVKSLIGKRYLNVTFDECNLSNDSFKKAHERCKKYCESSKECIKEGYGIYLYGDSGVGKTHLTACMCNELSNQLNQCLFTSFMEISKAIRTTFNSKTESEENLIERIVDVDVLFIDDLGTEILKRGNEDTWIQEKIYDVINKRYNCKKATIFSSNYSMQQLINERGMMQKTVDRIFEMSNAVIKIEGDSLRKKMVKKIPF